MSSTFNNAKIVLKYISGIITAAAVKSTPHRCHVHRKSCTERQPCRCSLGPHGTGLAPCRCSLGPLGTGLAPCRTGLAPCRCSLGPLAPCRTGLAPCRCSLGPLRTDHGYITRRFYGSTRALLKGGMCVIRVSVCRCVCVCVSVNVVWIGAVRYRYRYVKNVYMHTDCIRTNFDYHFGCMLH